MVSPEVATARTSPLAIQRSWSTPWARGTEGRRALTRNTKALRTRAGNRKGIARHSGHGSKAAEPRHPFGDRRASALIARSHLEPRSRGIDAYPARWIRVPRMQAETRLAQRCYRIAIDSRPLSPRLRP